MLQQQVLRRKILIEPPGVICEFGCYHRNLKSPRDTHWDILEQSHIYNPDEKHTTSNSALILLSPYCQCIDPARSGSQTFAIS